jgi:hypothetical protein
MTIQPWHKPIDEKSAAEIIRETRAPTEPKINLVQLADDLNMILEHCAWQWRLDLVASRQSRKVLEVFDSIARRLKVALGTSKNALVLQSFFLTYAPRVGVSEQMYRDLGIGPAEPGTPAEFDQRVVLAILRVFAAINLLCHWTDGMLNKSRVPKLSYSAIEILVAQWLPRYYEKYFAQQFGAGKGGKAKAGGPGIRFVLACLKAAEIKGPNGKPYSAETVRRYWQIVRKRSPRRRADKSHKNN